MILLFFSRPLYNSILVQSIGLQSISLEIEVKLMNDLKQGMQQLKNSWQDIISKSRLVVESINIPSTFPKIKRSPSIGNKY